MRLLHIVRDQKFIDDAYDAFEDVAPGQNQFVVIGSRELSMIKSFAPQTLSLRDVLATSYPAFIADFDAVLVHYLSAEARVAVDRCPAGVPLIWIGWGSDYYHLIETRRSLLLPLTEATYDELTSRLPARVKSTFRVLSEVIRHFRTTRERLTWLRVRWWLRHHGPGGKLEADLLARFSIFAPVLEDDFLQVAAATPSLRAEYVSWNYGIADAIEVMTDSPPSLGRNILVGNSATFEGNHVEALRMLRDVISDDSRVICPLSYGRQDYAEAVVREGVRIFGTRFQPLLEYLSLSDYMSILRSCSIVVMNHRRQQAVGNIALSLILGARVFLRRDNPVYRFLRGEGATVFDVDDLTTVINTPEPLSVEEIMSNRSVIERLYGRPAIRAKTSALLMRMATLARERHANA